MENQQQRFVLHLLAYAAQRDVPAEQLCRLAGIDLKALKRKEQLRFSEKQLNDLWQNASLLCKDPLVGLHLGESLQPSALGVVGEIIRNSSTAGEGITHAAALAPLVTDLFRMQVEQGRQSFTISFIPLRSKLSFACRQMMDLFMVFTVHELDGLLLEKIKPKAVRMPYAEQQLPEYERALRCRPVKKQDTYALVFDGKYWNEPIITASYELQSLLLQKVNNMPAPAQQTNSLPSRIYNYLVANSYLGIVPLEQIAASFNTSPRNLQRRLKEEGLRYQQLADEARKSLALHYLGSGTHAVKEVSHMLGYNELSAFSRAFRRWTGTTPFHYRSTLLQQHMQAASS